MPLPVAHGLLGASVVAALQPRSFLTTPGRLAAALLAGAFAANAADLDFLLVFALRSKTWHRGFTHSLAFALLVGAALAAGLGRERARQAAAYGLAFASHAVLDWVTTKEGGGVELLWPFTGERFVPGWWGLSEVPSRMPAADILKSLAVEFALFAPPLLAVLLWRRLLPGRAESSAEGSAG
ncbi:MAG TPA: metal-dependent hydrolase [Pyrinomonadaceae bacterium]|nr:metal-dependent hydrolase [Pyrinomonadaceae bacterium]